MGIRKLLRVSGVTMIDFDWGLSQCCWQLSVSLLGFFQLTMEKEGKGTPWYLESIWSVFH